MKKTDTFTPSENDIIFAKRIKSARESAGIKQFELAKMVNITPTTMSAYELFDAKATGKKPSLHNAIEISKALGISLDWLCGLSNDIQPPDSKLISDFINSKQHYGNTDMFIDFIHTSDTVRKILKSYARSFDQNPIQPDEDIADVIAEEEQRNSEEVVTITIRNQRIVKFLKGWVKMYDNYTEGIIDKEVFELWLKKSIDEVNNQQIKQSSCNSISDYVIHNIGEILTSDEGDDS